MLILLCHGLGKILFFSNLSIGDPTPGPIYSILRSYLKTVPPFQHQMFSFWKNMLKIITNDFALGFIDCTISANYDDLMLVFDRYIGSPLKDKMCQKRTKRKSAYFRFTDNTVIQNITLKIFLSSTKTKAELTK